MNKQELIKRIEDLPYTEGLIADTITINRNWILESIKQLDEPGKVTIPQYVAGWIKYCKLTGVNLYHALEMGDLYFCNYANQKDYSKLKEFFEVKGNQELFARAWLDGYEIQETKYVVTDGNHLYFKNYQEDIEIVILLDVQPGTMEYIKKFDTKKEAQKVADVLGWKVQEVE